ncbi:hypothetical protein HanOQP8_Chr02g0048991 [Helianthus annuus]|nr:hypothetical protein HanOQP8_Chr02g0048991 [Helianthus annuus]
MTISIWKDLQQMSAPGTFVLTDRTIISFRYGDTDDWFCHEVQLSRKQWLELSIHATLMCITCTYTLKSGLRLTLLNLFSYWYPFQTGQLKHHFL